MRGPRMWIACAVVGVAIMSAVFGTGSASAATVLCKVNMSPCPALSIYPSSTTFTVTGEFGLSSITGCEFTYKFTTKAASGTPLPAEITSFTFTRCGTGYTVTALSLPYSFPITVTGTGPDGTAKMLVPGEKGRPGFEVNGHLENGCQYTAAAIPQQIEGGSEILETGFGLANTAGISGCVTAGTSLSMGGFPTPKFFVTN